jgi:hypothetical protein
MESFTQITKRMFHKHRFLVAVFLLMLCGTGLHAQLTISSVHSKKKKTFQENTKLSFHWQGPYFSQCNCLDNAFGRVVSATNDSIFFMLNRKVEHQYDTTTQCLISHRTTWTYKKTQVQPAMKRAPIGIAKADLTSISYFSNRRSKIGVIGIGLMAGALINSLVIAPIANRKDQRLEAQINFGGFALGLIMTSFSRKKTYQFKEQTGKISKLWKF